MYQASKGRKESPMWQDIGGVLAVQDCPPALGRVANPTNVSQGSKRLLSLIQWYKRTCGECYPKQKFLASRLHVAISSVKRYLSELVSAGLVKVIHRGRRGSLYTPVDITRETKETEPVCEPDLTSPSLLLNLESLNTAKPPPRKLPQPALELPPPTVTNEYGRTDPNPAFLHIQHVLRGAQDRISRARNPFRYMQAIIRGELGIVPADHCERERRLAG